MSENQHGASNQAELLMLYEASGRDTWETKRQQWMVTYYGLLLHAALVGYVALRTEPEPSPVELASVEKLLIVILASFMAVSGFWYLTTSQISLVKFRRRAARIRTYLGEAFRQCYGEENPIRTSSHKDYWLVLTMMGALLAGAGIISWVVFETSSALIGVLAPLFVVAVEMLVWLDGQCPPE